MNGMNCWDLRRGVQVELAISRDCQYSRNGCIHINFPLGYFGNNRKSGTGREVLLSPILNKIKKPPVIVKAKIDKRIEIESVIPDEIEKYPWAGHLGIKLIDKVIPIIEKSRTTLIFINTRGMSERWYQEILNVAPELAGAVALHHGSIDMELRLLGGRSIA